MDCLDWEDDEGDEYAHVMKRLYFGGVEVHMPYSRGESLKWDELMTTYVEL